MIICSPCKREMTCVCTGKMVVFGGNHVYAGDEFRCGGCGATVVVASDTSYHMDGALTVDGGRRVLNMDHNPSPASPIARPTLHSEDVNA